jgi:hypothetical protein
MLSLDVILSECFNIKFTLNCQSIMYLCCRTVDETSGGEEILSFLQKEMSDDYHGPSVDKLRSKLRELQDQT